MRQAVYLSGQHRTRLETDYGKVDCCNPYHSNNILDTVKDEAELRIYIDWDYIRNRSGRLFSPVFVAVERMSTYTEKVRGINILNGQRKVVAVHAPYSCFS